MANALLSLQTARRVGNLAGRIVAAVCGEIAAELHADPDGMVHRRLAYAQRQVEALTGQVAQLMDDRGCQGCLTPLAFHVTQSRHETTR